MRLFKDSEISLWKKVQGQPRFPTKMVFYTSSNFGKPCTNIQSLRRFPIFGRLQNKLIGNSNMGRKSC